MIRITSIKLKSVIFVGFCFQGFNNIMYGLITTQTHTQTDAHTLECLNDINVQLLIFFLYNTISGDKLFIGDKYNLLFFCPQ